MKNKNKNQFFFDDEIQGFNKPKNDNNLYKKKSKLKKLYNKRIIILANSIMGIILILVIIFTIKIVNKKKRHKNLKEEQIKNITILNEILNKSIEIYDNNSNLNKAFENNVKNNNQDELNDIKEEEEKEKDNEGNNNENKNKNENIQEKPETKVNERDLAIEEGIKYLKICKQGILLHNKTKFKISAKPKISVVIPVYNCLNTIKEAVRSAQNQKMLDIEIILVNDNVDNATVMLTEELKKEDPRISILNNHKNMRTLYSRAKGVFMAKGEYITNLDCDDMFLIDDIFNVAYDSTDKGFFDVISFKSFQTSDYERKDRYSDSFTNKGKDNLVLYQPQLSCFCVSNNGTESVNDIYVWGKLYKTSVYKNALEMLGYERYSTHISWNEDYTQVFSIYNLAESYKFINKYGLYHKVLGGTFTDRSSRQEKIAGDVYFNEVVFEFGKPFCKKVSAQRVVSMKGYNAFSAMEDKTKIKLKQLLYRILDSNDIEQIYKDRIKEAYSEFFPPKIVDKSTNSTNSSNKNNNL